MKVAFLKSKKYLLLLLLMASVRAGHAQEAGLEADSVQTARERSLIVKKDILHLLDLGQVTAVRSRKSCNCGCNIIKESFRQKERRDFFDAFDFCDSYVFEYTSWDERASERFDELRQILRANDFDFVDKPESVKDKFKVKHRLIEGNDQLTFMEEKIYKSGKYLIRISLSTPE